MRGQLFFRPITNRPLPLGLKYIYYKSYKSYNDIAWVLPIMEYGDYLPL